MKLKLDRMTNERCHLIPPAIPMLALLALTGDTYQRTFSRVAL